MDYRKDYTLEDFRRKPLETRLDEVIRAITPLPKSLLYLALESEGVYKSGQDLQKALSKYLGIPIKRGEPYEIPMSLNPNTYLRYLSNDITELAITGVSPFIRVQVTPEKVGYTPTDFLKNIKPFIAYILKKCAEYGIDPQKLFGRPSRVKGKTSFMYTIKILEYIYEKGETSQSDIAKILNLPTSHNIIYSRLFAFKKLGLIEYRSTSTNYSRFKVYRVNKDKLEEMLSCLEDKKCKRKATYLYMVSTNIAREVIRYLIESDKDIITTRELIEYSGASYGSIWNIVKWLVDKGGLSSDIPFRKQSIIRITEKGKRIYEEIIRPILEVVENPDNIKKYSAELSSKDKWKLLKIYMEHKKT